MSNKKFHRATGAVAIASTLAPGSAWQLESVRVHLSAVGAAGNFTAKLDHGTGEAYDLVVATQDMAAITDYLYVPTNPIAFDAGTEMDFAWANASVRTYGLEVVWSYI